MRKVMNGTVEKNGDLLEFNIKNYSGDYKIYYSINKELDDKTLLVTGNKENIVVKNPINNKRIFFLVEDDNGEKIVLATRLVHVESIDNFRDLGGYITKDGKTVKWGYFYRCASLGKMSEGDKRYLEDTGIGTIFDFRSKIEVEGEPDIVPSNAMYINESGIRTMDENFKGKENFDMKSVIMAMVKNPERIGEVTNFLLDGYKIMVTHNKAFKELFNVIKDKNRVPLIFHCTAGKDRTGVGAALILLALGVSEEDVIKDYCLSNIYRKESNEKQMEGLKQIIKDEKVLEVITSLLSVKEEYIRITLNHIKQKYNSYEEYIINELNVTKDDLNNIKNNYLY